MRTTTPTTASRRDDKGCVMDIKKSAWYQDANRVEQSSALLAVLTNGTTLASRYFQVHYRFFFFFFDFGFAFAEASLAFTAPVTFGSGCWFDSVAVAAAALCCFLKFAI